MTRKAKEIKITGNFTNAENLKSNFLKRTSLRQKSKTDGNSNFVKDAGYWDGGRCEWGGTHKLDEDVEVLSNFFNSIANINGDINNIKISANETIFNQNKQALIAKLQSLISKCQITSSTSIGNICIIWNDFFGNFLKVFLEGFNKKLQRQLTIIEKLEPKHQKELLDLEGQARAAESAYKENLQKANDEKDPIKQGEFIVLANKASQEAERIKQKIKVNPLMEVGNFSYLDDLKKLTEGNVPKNVSSNKQPSNNKTNSSNILNKNFLTKYRKQIFIAVVGLGLIFYLYNDDDNSIENKRYEKR